MNVLAGASENEAPHVKLIRFHFVDSLLLFLFFHYFRCTQSFRRTRQSRRPGKIFILREQLEDFVITSILYSPSLLRTSLSGSNLLATSV